MTRLDHKMLWAAIDRLAENHGLSASGLAIKSGLDSTTFNRSKRKKLPATETLIKIMSATHTDLETFLNIKSKG